MYKTNSYHEYFSSGQFAKNIFLLPSLTLTLKGNHRASPHFSVVVQFDFTFQFRCLRPFQFHQKGTLRSVSCFGYAELPAETSA